MKKVFLLMIVWLQIGLHGYTQDSTRFKSITYKAKVYGVRSTVGYLSAYSDSSLFVSLEPISFSPNSTIKNFGERIDYQGLKEVSLKRKGSTVRGLAIGSASGALFGIALGLASGNDFKNNDGGWCIFCMTAGQKAAYGGVFFGGLGGITGTIIGAVSNKKFIIDGKKDRFDAMRNRLRSKM